MEIFTIDNWQEIGSILINAVLIYGSIILLTRLAGVRVYSKMTTFDFAITIAIGSVVASGIFCQMLDWYVPCLPWCVFYLYNG